jgi:hypothetical protein
MKTLVIADTNIAEVKIVTTTGVSKAQYGSGDHVLLRVTQYLNQGFTMKSSAGGVYVLELDDGQRVDVQK